MNILEKNSYNYGLAKTTTLIKKHPRQCAIGAVAVGCLATIVASHFRPTNPNANNLLNMGVSQNSSAEVSTWDDMADHHPITRLCHSFLNKLALTPTECLIDEAFLKQMEKEQEDIYKTFIDITVETPVDLAEIRCELKKIEDELKKIRCTDKGAPLLEGMLKKLPYMDRRAWWSRAIRPGQNIEMELGKLITRNPMNKVCLWLMPPEDSVLFRFHCFDINLMQRMTAQNCSICVENWTSARDFDRILERYANSQYRILVLFVRAHGNPKCIDPHQMIERTQKVALHLLPQGAKIVLNSCSTGGQAADGGCNIAEYWQSYAGPNRQIYAPKAPLSTRSLEMMNDEDPTFVFHDHKMILGDITFRPNYADVMKRLES